MTNDFFFRGAGGALLSSVPIDDLTQELDDDSARFYGGKYFIGESITEAAAERIALAFLVDLREVEDSDIPT